MCREYNLWLDRTSLRRIPFRFDHVFCCVSVANNPHGSLSDHTSFHKSGTSAHGNETLPSTTSSSDKGKDRNFCLVDRSYFVYYSPCSRAKAWWGSVLGNVARTLACSNFHADKLYLLFRHSDGCHRHLLLHGGEKSANGTWKAQWYAGRDQQIKEGLHQEAHNSKT